MAAGFYPPNATTACATSPGSAACQSCAQGGNGADPQCQSKPTYTAVNDWGYDLNLRHVHMKAKYGVDPQYPIGRYVTGLTSTVVPDRYGEYPTADGGVDPGDASADASGTGYVGADDCTNPLFAASLPDPTVAPDAGSTIDPALLCKLPAGKRPANFVFYTHIGGVPSSLLHYTPGDVNASTLTAADWTKILGKDPQNYDYTGIDSHMIESYQPRTGLAVPGSANGTDPVNGHEWITDQPVGVQGGHVLQVDRQYACIFPLMDSSGTPVTRDCTLAQNANFCDCPHLPSTLNAQQLPPICDTITPTLQVGAKAYPTIRELLLAKLLGTQGIVASICPEHVQESSPGDPLWGYRPAIGTLIGRLAPVIDRPPPQ
ncbi:MAG: hypothetical protein ACRENE_00870 [Polyangiaceae bacterium]